MYAANVDEALQDATMITGRLLLVSVHDAVLFNSNSVHTFITQTFISRIGIGHEDLDYNLVVTSFNRAFPTIRECVRGVVVAIQ